jgi:hypothetical protein
MFCGFGESRIFIYYPDGLIVVVCLAHSSYFRGCSARQSCAVTEEGKVLWLCRGASRDVLEDGRTCSTKLGTSPKEGMCLSGGEKGLLGARSLHDKFGGDHRF